MGVPFHSTWEYRPASKAWADIPFAASTCQLPSISGRAFPIVRDRPLPFACLGFLSLAALPVLWLQTSGSAIFARLSPSANHIPVWPSLFESALFARCAQPAANQWHANLAVRVRTHVSPKG